MKADPLQSLKKVIAGLEYPSESDALFELFRWPASGGDDAQQQVISHAGANRKIAQVGVDEFFAALSDSEDAARFVKLRRALAAKLKDLKIFRAGEGEAKVDIYLIGRTAAGEWAGVHTTSIET